MTTVRIEHGPTVAKVYFPFNADIVAIVKTVPGKAWVPGGKYWTVPIAQAASLRQALESRGCTVVATGAGNAEPQTELTALRRENARLRREAQARGTDWAEQLLARCDPDLSEKVFRALTKALHPDTGGDNDLMRDLNVARDRLLVRR